MQSEERAATTIAETMKWAKKQADVPAYDGFCTRGPEIRFEDPMTGEIFSMTVRRI